MWIGFASHQCGEHSSWLCADWKEMREEIECLISQITENQDLTININDFMPEVCESSDIHFELPDTTWVTIQKANDYSIEQCKKYIKQMNDNQ